MVRADAGNTRRPNTSPFYKGLVINNYIPDNNYITGGRSVPRSGARRIALFRGMY